MGGWPSTFEGGSYVGGGDPDSGFNAPVNTVNLQIATIESMGLTRRFDYDRDKDMYTSYAYA
jgi:hypothetical protein